MIDPEELGLLEHASDGAEIVRPLRTLTRKSIKPRKLFETPTRKSKRSQVDEEIETEVDEDEPEEQPSPTRASRSRGIMGLESASSAVAGTKRKRGSPFDKWPRLKSGSRSVSATSIPASASRGRKRNAAEALDA